MTTRVLQVVPTLLSGGAEHVACFYAASFHEPGVPALFANSGGPGARLLHRRGVEFRLTSPLTTALHRNAFSYALTEAAAEGREWLRGVLRRPADATVTQSILPLCRPGSPMATSLRRLVERVRPACLHLHTGHLVGAGRIARAVGVKTILQVHNVIGERHDAKSRDALAAELEYVDAVVCVAQFQAEDFARSTGWPRERITVLPNPSFNASGRRAAIRPHPQVVGCLGNLGGAKGIDRLLDAFAALINRMPEARLEVAGGTARMRRYWAHQAAGRGLVPPRIQFVGALRIPDGVDRWFAGIDLLASTSITEAYPLQIVEALSRGIPVVASDISAHRELLGDGAGTLAQAADPEAFAGALAGLLCDRDRLLAISDAGFEHWRLALSNEHSVTLLNALYERMTA